MNDHYFTAQPSARTDERTHEYTALGHAFCVTTDAGVFSKGGLDDGSRIMLAALPALSGRVLDLGCGWGAMGLALAKANPAAQFVLSDVNARAVELARRNLAAAGIANAEVFVSDGLSQLEGTFDVVVTNPPIRAGKQVIYRLFEQSHARLNEGGALYVVIRKQQGAPSAEKFLVALFGHARMIAREKGYWIIECRKNADRQEEENP